MANRIPQEEKWDETFTCINCTEKKCYMDKRAGAYIPCPILKEAKEKFLVKQKALRAERLAREKMRKQNRAKAFAHAGKK